MPSLESLPTGGINHLPYVQGGIERRSLSSLPLCYQAAGRWLRAFRPFANLKSPSMSAVKLWARSWLTPLFHPSPFPPLLFFFKKERRFGSCYLQQGKKNTPQPYILLIFSLYSNRTQLAKAIILPLAVEMFKGCYTNEKL